MARKLRAILVSLTLAVTAVLVVAPQPAFAACQTSIGTPFVSGTQIVVGGTVNGCGGRYKIQLAQVYWWGDAPVNISPEFRDGGGSVAFTSCNGGTHTWVGAILKYENWFWGFTEWIRGQEVRFYC